jgi:hypothetical protein
MTPHLPVMPCRACGACERPTLTTGPSGTYVAYCAQCGARIKALPNLTRGQFTPAHPRRDPHASADMGHPALLAQQCRHYHSITEPRINPGRGPHAGAAVCGECGGFLRWIRKSVMAQLQSIETREN